MKHTPGPWKIDERVGCIAIYPENETHNCLDLPRQNFVAYWHGYMDENKVWQVYEKDQANANLIASAPELLEVCKEVVKWAETGTPIHIIQELDVVIKKVKQAITGAERKA